MSDATLQLTLCKDGLAHVFRYTDDGLADRSYCGGEVERAPDDAILTDATDVCESGGEAVSVEAAIRRVVEEGDPPCPTSPDEAPSPRANRSRPWQVPLAVPATSDGVLGLLDVAPAYETSLGAMHQGDALDLLRRLPEGSVNLVVTSPPYALHFKKEYGNVTKGEYVDWLQSFAVEIRRVLTDDGSFVLNIGGSYNAGSPTIGASVLC
jgi:hypothetical protein